MGRTFKVLFLISAACASSAFAGEVETLIAKCTDRTKYQVCADELALGKTNNVHTTLHRYYLRDLTTNQYFSCQYQENLNTLKMTTTKGNPQGPSTVADINLIPASCRVSIAAKEKERDDNYTKSSQDLGELLGDSDVGQQVKVDGKTYNVVRGPEGKKVLENPATGEWYDKNLKEVHTKNEFVIGDKVYHNQKDFSDAGGLQTDGAVAIRYDSKGNKLSELVAVKNEKGEIDLIEKKFDSKGEVISKRNATEEKKKAQEDARTGSKKKAKEDDCQSSYDYAVAHGYGDADKFKCSKTNTIVKATEVTNQLMQGVGKSMVTRMGQTAASKARTGRPADDYKATANMAKTAANYETVMGVANIAAGVALAKRANQHSKNAAVLSKEQGDNKLMRQYGVTDENGVAVDVALQEQRKAKQTAKEAQFVAIVNGAKNLASMVAAKQQQKQYEAAAKTQAQIDQKLQGTQVTFGGLGQAIGIGGQQSGATAGGPGGGLNGPGGPGTGTDADGDGKIDGSGNLLGSGSDSSNGDDSIGAPRGGKFTAGADPVTGGGGGGAGPGSAGGGGGGAPTVNEESKAQYAGDLGAKGGYDNAGVPGGGAKGGSKGGGDKEDPGIDMNSLLAQFLPKTTEDIGPQNGILDYQGGAGRGIASTEEPASYLDKNADLFQRVHETYAEKTRKGQVGL